MDVVGRIEVFVVLDRSLLSVLDDRDGNVESVLCQSWAHLVLLDNSGGVEELGHTLRHRVLAAAAAVLLQKECYCMIKNISRSVGVDRLQTFTCNAFIDRLSPIPR